MDEGGVDVALGDEEVLQAVEERDVSADAGSQVDGRRLRGDGGARVDDDEGGWGG